MSFGYKTVNVDAPGLEDSKPRGDKLTVAASFY